MIEPGLSNINTTLHTSLLLLNVACIGNKESRYFYWECITDLSLDNLMDALNKERKSPNEIEGMKVLSLAQIIQSRYRYQGTKRDTASELQQCLPDFVSSRMPPTMDYHRYVTEDLLYGLI